MRYLERKLSADLDYIDLYAVSDVHRGHPKFNLNAWQTLLQKIAKDPHARMVLNGDGVESALKSSKYGETYASLRPKEERKLLQQELELVKDKIDAITSGNHDARAEKDSDENVMERVAEHLGLLDHYDPASVVLDLSFGTRNGGKDKATSFDFFIAHGQGGGRRPGSKLNRLQEWAWIVDGVDGYISGHVHSLMSYIENRFTPDPYNKCVSMRPVAYLVAGSFLDYGGYAEIGLYSPNAVSMPYLRLYQKRRTDKHKEMQIVLPTRISPARDANA